MPSFWPFGGFRRFVAPRMPLGGWRWLEAARETVGPALRLRLLLATVLGSVPRRLAVPDVRLPRPRWVIPPARCA